MSDKIVSPRGEKLKAFQDHIIKKQNLLPPKEPGAILPLEIKFVVNKDVVGNKDTSIN